MDKEIADRLRNENPEQFQTLVRMHLSFELDLSTDPVENDTQQTMGSVASVKLRSKKLFAFPKKSKQLHSTSKSQPFNVVDSLTPVGIEQIKQMIRFLMESQNIIQEGIFRRTGSVARQNELRRRLNEQTTLDFSNGVYTVHDCASVLKSIIADLPEPLLTDHFYAVHCQIAELYNSNQIEHNQMKETRLLHSIQLLLLLLPLENRSLFYDIINMLNETTKYESSNKMSSESLATLFTPHLICPRKLTPEALHAVSQNMSGLVSFMIGKGDELQCIPPKLSTDIRAYLVEQRRKKVLSPELQILDESVTSDSTANTVYTFVDREKTAEAHNSNSTDTALAQLYAHIQSLPDDRKKRKLIKQFNKENGQGTPLQQQMLMRLKKGNVASPRPNKSLSGSIKKHIFHSALGSKTPKRGSMTVSTPSLPGMSTPVSRRGLDSTPKSQSTFHTPIGHRLNATRTETLSSSLETPKSAMKNSKYESKSTETLDKIAIDGDSEITENKSERKEMAKIKFAQGADNHNDQHYHTPISFKMSKFIMCFKSEPDLSRVQDGIETAPILNRGRFIAKKLLSGVSMINLRRPFVNSNEKAATRTKPIINDESSNDNAENMSKKLGDEIETNKMSIAEPQACFVNENKIDDDDEDFVDDEEVDREYDDSVDKENQSPLHYKTIEYISKLNPPPPLAVAINCGAPLSDSITNDSVSPITKSTHRMSKAMQESIMTPRSRKPVIIIGAMRGLTSDNYHQNFINFEMDEVENSFDCENTTHDRLDSSLQRSKSESSLQLRSPIEIKSVLVQPSTLEEQRTVTKSNSDETLSTPFSRSLLMTTPVDSSFSSQSDDFENLNDSEMSESLIYCLNGNEPNDVGLPNINDPVTPRSTNRIFPSGSSVSFKRPLKNDDDLGKNSLSDPVYGEYSCINAKKNHLELDETAL
ncbi:uncharacterized protein LOC116345492 isoform X2 [Contarinia nasturtii]|uniref:uncharacterized protein LOC116345492 isoform X2 n=1 Tax=Contarinia nasturtii TaxID=265458 RepID=UPI0012D3CAE1|nr:uncharacterized protein LOC116345492 isoform X2 [Contarinia nasturtii]